MATYTVTAALVVAHVGGKVQHLYHGDVVPSNIDEDSLANLKSLGFVSTSEEATPDGDPSESWTKDQLTKYAGDKGVDVSGAKNKAEIVAALDAASKA